MCFILVCIVYVYLYLVNHEYLYFSRYFADLTYFFLRVQLGSLQTEIRLRSQCGQSFNIIHVFKNIGFSFLPGLSLFEQCVLIIAASLATIYNALQRHYVDTRLQFHVQNRLDSMINLCSRPIFRGFEFAV